jgi:hypothetical protein
MQGLVRRSEYKEVKGETRTKKTGCQDSFHEKKKSHRVGIPFK